MIPHGHGENGHGDLRTSGTDAWYRTLVERVPAVLYVDASDESSSALYISPQGESLLGYSKEEWLADPDLWVKTLHPDDRERVLAEHLRVHREGSVFESEYRLIARDGSVVWVRDEAEPVRDADGEHKRRTGILLDVTERKLYEEKLRTSERRYRELFENAMEGIARISPEGGTIEHCNPAYARMLGLTPAEAAGRSFFEFVDGGDEQEARRQRELRLRGVGSQYEVTVTDAVGGKRTLSCGGYPLYGPDGAYEGAVQTVTDVTERRRWEEDLRRSEERFKTTFEAAAVGMAHLSPDGRWLRINDALCEISGYRREELLGMSHLDLSLPEDLAAAEKRVRLLLEGETDSYSIERRYVRKDGSRVWVDLSISLVRKEPSREPDYFVCVARDITASKIGELVPNALTSREAEVLGRVVAGETDRAIARELSYSEGTVKLEIRHILQKLGVDDRRQAAARAVTIGLASPSPRGSRNADD